MCLHQYIYIQVYLNKCPYIYVYACIMNNRAMVLKNKGTRSIRDKYIRSLCTKMITNIFRLQPVRITLDYIFFNLLGLG
jgi:hypothetical protein